jgi:hypothetical protein
MDMTQYLAEMKFAVDTVIKTMWEEHSLADQLQDELSRLDQEVSSGYARADSLMRHSDDLDDFMMGVGAQYETYFGPDKQRHYKTKELLEVEERMAVKRFSTYALAGSLLQYGKQGISLVHHQRTACPVGRTLLGVSLRDLIWYGRNQALHWEEGNFRPELRAFFETLNAADTRFGAYSAGSMAFDVVELLSWKDLASFQQDMTSLA